MLPPINTVRDSGMAPELARIGHIQLFTSDITRWTETGFQLRMVTGAPSIGEFTTKSALSLLAWGKGGGCRAGQILSVSLQRNNSPQGPPLIGSHEGKVAVFELPDRLAIVGRPWLIQLDCCPSYRGCSGPAWRVGRDTEGKADSLFVLDVNLPVGVLRYQTLPALALPEHFGHQLGVDCGPLEVRKRM